MGTACALWSAVASSRSEPCIRHELRKGIHHDGHNCYAISVAPAAQLTPMISGGNGGELPGHVASLTYYDTVFVPDANINAYAGRS